MTLSDLLQGYLLFWQILFHNLQSSLATIVSQPVASCWQLICVSTNELLIYYIIRSHSLIVYYLDDRYRWIYINITVRPSCNLIIDKFQNKKEICSFRLQFTASDSAFGIIKLFLRLSKSNILMYGCHSTFLDFVKFSTLFSPLLVNY